MTNGWGFEKIKMPSYPKLKRKNSVVREERESRRLRDQWREEDLENVRVQKERQQKRT